MLRLDVSERDLAAAADAIVRETLTELSQAVAEETRGLEQDLEGITRMAVPGRLWRAWKSESFPKGGGPAREPAGEVYVNGGNRSQGAMVFATQKGRISHRGGDGEWLAVPTKAAGSRGRGRNLTPSEWERITGQRLTYRPSKSNSNVGLLVADGVTNRRSGAFRPATEQRAKGDARRGAVRNAKPIVIFVLIPFVDFRPAFSVDMVYERRAGLLAARVGRIGAGS